MVRLEVNNKTQHLYLVHPVLHPFLDLPILPVKQYLEVDNLQIHFLEVQLLAHLMHHQHLEDRPPHPFLEANKPILKMQVLYLVLLQHLHQPHRDPYLEVDHNKVLVRDYFFDLSGCVSITQPFCHCQVLRQENTIRSGSLLRLFLSLWRPLGGVRLGLKGITTTSQTLQKLIVHLVPFS